MSNGPGRPSLMQPIIVGVVLALLVGTSSPWWWNEVFPPADSTAGAASDSAASDEGSNDGSSGATGDGGDDPAGTASGGGDTSSNESDDASSGSTGCEIVIENPLVTLYEETDTFGLEAGRASPGTYAVQEIATVTFAGNPQRWFRITSGGVTGWLQDSSILIASKSGPCA